MKHIPYCPSKEYNTIFKHIHQNAECQDLFQKKKSALIIDLENIGYWEEAKQSEVLAKEFGLFQTQSLWESHSVTMGVSGTFCNFCPHVSLGTVFLALNWHKIVIKMWTFVLEKFNHKLGPPLSLQTSVPRRLSSQSNKKWN